MNKDDVAFLSDRQMINTLINHLDHVAFDKKKNRITHPVYIQQRHGPVEIEWIVTRDEHGNFIGAITSRYNSSNEANDYSDNLFVCADTTSLQNKLTALFESLENNWIVHIERTDGSLILYTSDAMRQTKTPSTGTQLMPESQHLKKQMKGLHQSSIKIISDVASLVVTAGVVYYFWNKARK